MELLGKSLSDFKKPLIIVVIIVLVLLFVLLLAVEFNVVNTSNRSVNPIIVADVSFTQAKISDAPMNETNRYIVHLSVDDMYKDAGDGSPQYLVVTKVEPTERTRFARNISVDPSEHDDVPNNVSLTPSVSQPSNGIVLANESDSAYIIGLKKGDQVQVFGGDYGRENQVATYKIT